jgi:DNA mismatch endonuclease, patch repair protein
VRAPEVTTRIMAAVRGRDSRAEVLLRSELHRRGLRFRKNVPSLPGKPDIVFTSARVAVFVDGDWWHGHGWRERGFASFEDQFNHARADWWRAKIERNVERDREVNRALRKAGWRVVRVWESRVLKDPSRAAARVERRVRAV